MFQKVLRLHLHITGRGVELSGRNPPHGGTNRQEE